MRTIFTDANMPTKFGNFMIRVYADTIWKETVVLSTQKLDPTKPVLVRIHSECMTGDVFWSLRCDCGEQLAQSLEQISNSCNGVLIYLRQEGRGIGLFEKIRSYQLQEKGYDTHEANVLLWHEPDSRTYEKAQIALSDLGITQIRLLTNNPSKVSEIAKLGIQVIERVPLIMPTNEHNQHYFMTKRNKFKHFFNEEVSYYFYQFHADTTQHVEEIGEYLRGTKRDPLLKICIGITACKKDLENPEFIIKIESVFRVCELYEGFVPVLHYSFRDSADPKSEITEIREKLPFVKYLQTNDLLDPDLATIELACSSFLADIPLSDAEFHLVHDPKFRRIISHNKAFVLLDNSKGTWLQESRESLAKKIETLIGYGLNDIAIFGGFWPDDLETYFELRRHYRINFSIDAETKLKTSGQIDIEKTKLYLSQLIRFDDPKAAGIEQTRTFLQQNRDTNWKTLSEKWVIFHIHPAVFNASAFDSTTWFSSVIDEVTKGQSDFCEVGCGAGISSCIVGLTNPKIHIVATDINPFATENARLNATTAEIADRFEAFNGDVLDSIPTDKKFDTIFWALPFGFLDPGTSITIEEMQVFDPGYRATRKFFSTAKDFLKPHGCILIGFSPELWNEELLYALAKNANLKLSLIEETKINEKEELVFQVLKGMYWD